MYRILVINPGSTSTRISVFEDEDLLYEETLVHAPEELAKFDRIASQYAFRRDTVRAALCRADLSIQQIHAVVGRGGMLRPVASGTYSVTQRMLDDSWSLTEREHPANLGAVIAHELASEANLPAFIVDPVSVDEFDDIARVSGLPGFERRSLSHALNLKAAARQAACALGASYQDLNLVVVHMGGGISVSAHRRGRQVDVNQALDGTGPFSPERAGGLPTGDVMRLAFSGRYHYDELFALITRKAGLYAHLGTNDAREVERRIVAGDEHARLVYEAMAYQVAKEIGLMATVLKGNVRAIVLTGGLAHSQMLIDWIRERVEWIAPVLSYPGQQEMLSLAQGVLRVLRGEEPAKEY